MRPLCAPHFLRMYGADLERERLILRPYSRAPVPGAPVVAAGAQSKNHSAPRWSEPARSLLAPRDETRAPGYRAGSRLNAKSIAEYCGTSVEMIDRHYGKFMRDRAEAQLRLLMEAEDGRPEIRREATGGTKPATLGGGFPVHPGKVPGNMNAGDGARTRTGETPTGF